MVEGAVVYQWCEFKSRRGKNKKLTALKSNSNTVWFNFQTYIYNRADIYDLSKNIISNFTCFQSAIHLQKICLSNSLNYPIVHVS